VIRRSAKFVVVLGTIGVFAAHAALLPLWMRSRWRRMRALAVLAHRYSAFACRVMGIRVRVDGTLRPRAGNVMLVSNHLSYVDMLVIASQIPSCFVTSMDMRATMGIGHLCRAAGCLFVDRRRMWNLKNEIAEIAEALEEGLDVAVFPEATSTNGAGVMPFRRALYESAVKSRRPVQPVCLNYEAIDGRSLDVENRDRVYWYGDMTFLPHLWELVSVREITVTLNAFEPLRGESVDAKRLASRSYELVKSRFVPCPA